MQTTLHLLLFAAFLWAPFCQAEPLVTWETSLGNEEFVTHDLSGRVLVKEQFLIEPFFNMARQQGYDVFQEYGALVIYSPTEAHHITAQIAFGKLYENIKTTSTLLGYEYEAPFLIPDQVTRAGLFVERTDYKHAYLTTTSYENRLEIRGTHHLKENVAFGLRWNRTSRSERAIRAFNRLYRSGGRYPDDYAMGPIEETLAFDFLWGFNETNFLELETSFSRLQSTAMAYTNYLGWRHNFEFGWQALLAATRTRSTGGTTEANSLRVGLTKDFQ